MTLCTRRAKKTIFEKIGIRAVNRLSIKENFDEKKILNFENFHVKMGQVVKKKKSKHILPDVARKKILRHNLDTS